MKLLHASNQSRYVRIAACICMALSLVASVSVPYAASAKSSSKSKSSRSVDDASQAEAQSDDSAGASKKTRLAANKKGDSDKTEKADKSDKSAKTAKSDKSDKSEQSEKSEKADKSEKGKSDKADKADKSKDKNKKASSDKEGDADKNKSGGGIFGFGGGAKKKTDKAKGDDPAEKASEKTEKAEAEDPKAPKWRNDPALVSVLKDISKSLKDSEAVQKLEDPAEKLIAKLAGDALERAVTSAGMQPNRIFAEKDRARMTSSMTAEAFESGDVVVAPDLRASVVALWAKKIDGLLTVSIVGDYDGNIPGSENKLGEFVAVITAQSAVDKGFDIQSQQEVNYWIGKVCDLKIDRGSNAAAEKKSYYRLLAPVTARKRQYFDAVVKYQEEKVLAARKLEEEKKKADETASSQKMAEVLAKHVAEALAKATKTGGENTAAPATQSGGTVAEKKSEGAGDQPAPAGVVATAPPVSTPPVQAVSTRPVATTPIFPEAGRSGRGPWDSPAPAAASRPASANATVLYPSKALAGQFLTVSIVGAESAPEPFVDVNFNGANVPTNENGKVIYQVPEDATPGYSLHLGMTSRPAETPGAVNILQPLTVPSGPQVPKVDGLSPVVSARGYMILEGHNFDGIAERNRVIVDGVNDATVLASSPVQLVAKLPANLGPGQHSVSVSTAGLRSNPGQFEFVSVEVNPVGPDSPRNDLKRLGVRVVGTQNKLRVKVINHSKDVVKLLRGDEVVVVTSGGANNAATIQAQRLRSGNFHIETEILM